MGMFVRPPEFSQHAQGILRQWHQPVFVALGVANMNLHIRGVYIANGEPDAFTKPQPHAVGGKEKDPVAHPVGCGKEFAQLLDGQDIRDPGNLWWFDQRNIRPGLVEYPGIKKLQAIQIELDCTPGMAFQEFVEIIEQLIGSQVVNLAIEIVSDTPDGP